LTNPCTSLVHGAQVTGGSKLDPRSTECRLLGYAQGAGNYRVQEISTRRIFVSRDVVFEEGIPHRTLESVGEEKHVILFDTLPDANTPLTNEPDHTINHPIPAINHDADVDGVNQTDQRDVQVPVIAEEPHRSTRVAQPSMAGTQSVEDREREAIGRNEGLEWATNWKLPKASYIVNWSKTDQDIIACLIDTKSSHNIPRYYRHAMSIDPERWMIAMKTEMETLKAKHTWDLVKSPPGANIMGSMWVYDIKWDGEGNRIKDKARLVGKGYTQQLGVDYNETWAAVTRLESVRMTAAVAAKLDLKLWRLDFVGAHLNSVTKEDIYMKQPEGFVDPDFEDYVCKLVHTIYGTMQGVTTGTRLSRLHTTNSVTLHPAQIPASDSRKRMGTIPSQTHTQTTFLVLQTMMMRFKRGREK
jgi:hypothetical protein